MATITSTGIGSGLDVNALVTQLVAAERAPADKRLTQTDAKLTTEFTALSRLKAAMAAFQGSLAGLKTASALNVRTAKVRTSWPSRRRQRLRQHPELRRRDPAAGHCGTTGFAAVCRRRQQHGGHRNTHDVQWEHDSFDIEIDAENSSLADIRDAINNAADNSGVRATLIRDTTGTGSYLVLSGARTGEANAITVSATGARCWSRCVRAGAQRRSMRCAMCRRRMPSSTCPAMRSAVQSNTVTGAIDGVTLNLRSRRKSGNSFRSRSRGTTQPYAPGFRPSSPPTTHWPPRCKSLGAYDRGDQDGRADDRRLDAAWHRYAVATADIGPGRGHQWKLHDAQQPWYQR